LLSAVTGATIAVVDSLHLMTLVSFIVFMSRGITGPVSSLYAESLGASYAAIGLLGTVASISTILFGYLWGHTSDLLGRRKGLLVAGLAAGALNEGLIAIAPSYVSLFFLRLLGGVAMSAYATASLALVGDLLERSDRARGRRMGVYRGLGSLGFGLMAFLSGTIADALSLRVPFALAGAFLIVAFVLVLQVREPAAARAPGHRWLSLIAQALGSLGQDVRRWYRGLTERRSVSDVRDATEGTPGLPLAPLLVAAFLWALVTGAVYAVWANYMVTEIGYTSAVMSRLWAIASTAEFPLMIVAGWLSDRLGRLPMLCLGFLAWAIVFVGYVLVPGMPWILLLQLTRGFAYSAHTATAMTYATEVRGRAQRGWVAGLYGAAGGLGSILGASLGGLQTQWMGFRPMIATNAALIFAGAIYLAVVFLRQRHRAALVETGPRA
jgi:MFS transporter, SET family, sugar efflux transporter